MNRKQRRMEAKSGAAASARATPPAVTEALGAALRLHQAGRLDEAEAAYAAILKLAPKQADALHLLGVIRHQRGDHAAAVETIGRAIAVNPTSPSYFSNRGNALQALGRLAEALADYDAALRLKSDLAEVHSNRGNALKGLGRLDEALSAFRRALDLRPGYAHAHFNRGNALQALGRLDEAVADYDAALAALPDYVEAHANRGNALKDLGRLDEALAAYDAAIARRPDWVEAHYNRSNVLQQLGRLDEALAAFDLTLGLDPGYAPAHANRGTALQQAGRPEEALAAFDAAIRLKPDHVEAHSNRGNLLQELGRFDEAMAAFDRALGIDPSFADAFVGRGVALHGAGRIGEALDAYDAAIGAGERAEAAAGGPVAEGGGLAAAHFNRGLMLLRCGRLAEGFAEYEWRWRRESGSSARPRHQHLPRWHGEAAEGRTLLVWAEQGLGDTLQFVRYVPLVADRGWRVALEVPRALVGLFASLASASVEIVAVGDPLPSADLQCPLMSLAGVFETTLATIPAPVALTIAPELVEDWRRRLPADRFEVGIVWQGNPANRNDRHRSVSVDAFAPLARIDGVELIGLQKEFGAAQAAALPDGLAIRAIGLDEVGLTETAAAILGLDLVVAVDTAIAHLAGTLGVPVWVPLSASFDWRWLLERRDSPWYPSLRLYRQTKLGRWDDVFARIAADLEARVRGRPAS